MISVGPSQGYLIDISITKGNYNLRRSLIPLLEDIQNVMITGIRYGKYRQFFMNPPHVIIFLNKKCPIDMTSANNYFLSVDL